VGKMGDDDTDCCGLAGCFVCLLNANEHKRNLITVISHFPYLVNCILHKHNNCNLKLARKGNVKATNKFHFAIQNKQSRLRKLWLNEKLPETLHYFV